MTDTVLQSFCERCGTRYTSAAHEEHQKDGDSKLGRFKRRGSEDTPKEAGASTTLPSSDAFKGTFHFCLECRQYACGDCWNDQEGHCVGCRPIGGVTKVDAERPQDPSPAPGITVAARASATADAQGAPATGSNAWPTDDLERAVASAPDSSAHDHGPVGSPDEHDRDTEDATEQRDAPTADANDVSTAAASRRAGNPWDGSAAPAISDSDSAAAEADPHEEVTRVDEWGRTVKGPASPGQQDSSADKPAPPTSAPIDPWRGVVFSEEADERRPIPPAEQPPSPAVFSASSATQEADLAEQTAAEPTTPEQTARGDETSTAWPGTDKTTEPPQDAAATGPVWPDADRKGEAGEDATGSAPTDEIEAPGAASKAPVPDDDRAADPTIEPASNAEPEAAVEPVAVAQPEEDGRTAAERILGVAGVAGAAASGPIPDNQLEGPAAPAPLGVAPMPEAKPEGEALPNPSLSFVAPEPTVEPEPPPEPSTDDVPSTVPEPPLSPPVVASLGAAPPALLPQPATSGPFSEPFTTERAPPAVPVPVPPGPQVAAPPGATQQPPVAPQPPMPPPQQPVASQPVASQQAAPQPPVAPQPPMPPPQQVAPQPYPGPIVGAQGQPVSQSPSSSRAPATQRTASHGCPSCGLPLSTKARFCRRCGAPQG